jgi:hypothetical protein
MTGRDVDQKIDVIARRQDGVFSVRQASKAGATSGMRRRRVANGQWLRLDRGVLALASHPGSWRRQCRAALLTIDQAALSHTAAAAVHGLSDCRPGGVHIVVPPGTNHRTKLATVHESSWPKVRVIDGLRAVDLTDTLFQLAAATSPLRLRRAFESAVVEHGLALPALRDRCVELARKRLPGIGHLRELIEEHGEGAPPAESELERLLGDVLDECVGFPGWTRQAALPGWERGSARVDVLVPEWRLVIEADGRRWHARLDDFDRDRWRDNLATAAGYDVLRFTHHQLTAGKAECLCLLANYGDLRSVG